ncbi:DNA replication licensing factor mcm5-A [Trichinella zimbabwensis]|uniref:DNA helicase n=1 Tax=Trichinella zimbabwensis TaxID=268475 RepID=A0A0V1I4M6_9BILA|nr:DNA replication licensing factor mcm5-A [Trichinella zimbabwensis]
MSGFDRAEIQYAGHDEQKRLELALTEEGTLKFAKSKFKKFIREFNYGSFAHIYRENLRNHCKLGKMYLEVRLQDMRSYNSDLAYIFQKNPTEVLPMFEEVAKDVAEETTYQGSSEVNTYPNIQVIITSDENSQPVRSLQSKQISKVVKLRGIIVSTSQVRCKATSISIQCRNCQLMVNNIAMQPGFDGYALPRRCNSNQIGQQQKCPVDPFVILPDKCRCIDFQVLKLQECPEDVPHGELPRHMVLYCDRYLTDRVTPGNKVSVLGIYCIRKQHKMTKREKASKPSAGLRQPYIRVIGIEVESSGLGRTAPQALLSPEDEKQMRELAAQPDIYERIAKSIAPSIYGSEDVKKAIACLLFGGSRKRLPDGLMRRGDINVLLLGDPGMAKSQLLKFVEKVSPIGVYTSGKGSSAAGLTASIVRDASSRSFVMEGGAMVLADGGVVCIDEFDKMREDDRVAIHEAMEQQTISIAKAGITTTLNSRCAVLAAANSVYGRWDASKGEDNIDFMPTILSRFDTIFVIRDVHSETRDMALAKHVISVHVGADTEAVRDEEATDGEIPLATLKKYIAFCRTRCGPRLNRSATRKLIHSYTRMRNVPVAQQQKELHIAYQKSSIPITVRQLEALIRIAEALAKMELSPYATDRHVDEALRLFQVSTLAAASQGTLSGGLDCLLLFYLLANITCLFGDIFQASKVSAPRKIKNNSFASKGRSENVFPLERRLPYVTVVLEVTASEMVEKSFYKVMNVTDHFEMPMQSVSFVTIVRQVGGVLTISAVTFIEAVFLSRRRFNAEMILLAAYFFALQLNGIGYLLNGIRFSNVRKRNYFPMVPVKECLLTHPDVTLSYFNYILRPFLLVYLAVDRMCAVLLEVKNMKKVTTYGVISVYMLSLFYVIGAWLETFLLHSDCMIKQNCIYWSTVPWHHQKFQKYMHLFGLFAAVAIVIMALFRAYVKRRKEVHCTTWNFANDYLAVTRRLSIIVFSEFIFRGLPLLWGCFVTRTVTMYTVRMTLYVFSDIIEAFYGVLYCYINGDLRESIVSMCRLFGGCI